MTRKDCEKKILDKLAEIWAIYRKYAPRGEYLEMILMVTDEGLLKTGVNNVYWEEDQHNPIQVETRETVK